MRVRVSYGADCPDWWREEIRRFYGKPGKATRAECVAWLKAYGSSEDENLAYSAQKREDEVYDLIGEIGGAP